MFENVVGFFKKLLKKEDEEDNNKDVAKERLHLVLMQDRANVSADFLEMMKQEIIEVIKKYIDVDENSIDVRLTNQTNEDGTNGAPALYANIPIISIKEEKKNVEETNTEEKEEVNKHNEDNETEEQKSEEENESNSEMKEEGKHSLIENNENSTEEKEKQQEESK